MSSLLTREEYQAIADSLTLPVGAFIDGKLTQTRTRFDSINPANRTLLQAVAVCEATEVDLAVDKAREVFESRIWAGLAPAERKKVLIKLAKLIRRERHELAVMESLDSGKPIRDIETVDIPEALHCLEWHAELADKIYDQVAPTGDDAVALVVREPIGVVACVLPWNFPILMLVWKLAPALAAGNSIIIKPAEQTSLTALRIAELAHEAGVPRGVLSVLPGPGEVTGQALGLHPDIDMVSFTGSSEVGRLFLNYSAASNLKKIVLECGGKNPCIVLDDAERLDAVAAHVLQAAFWNMGENCSANSRLIVHEKVRDALLDRMLTYARDWRTGDPLDPVNRLGAIVSHDHHNKIMSYIAGAQQQGAELALGGRALAQETGYFIEPTIFTGVKPDMTLAREEVFGPVLAVISVNSVEQAIQVANDTPYGLTASLFTGSVKRAHRVGRAIRAGTVTVNCYGEGDISTPFGGYKQSGFGGRDNSIHAHDQYTELKTLWLDLADDATDDLIDEL